MAGLVAAGAAAGTVPVDVLGDELVDVLVLVRGAWAGRSEALGLAMSARRVPSRRTAGLPASCGTARWEDLGAGHAVMGTSAPLTSPNATMAR